MRALLAAGVLELLAIGAMTLFFTQEKPQPPVIPPLQLVLVAQEPPKVIPPPPPRPEAKPTVIPKASPRPTPRPVAKPVAQPVHQAEAVETKQAIPTPAPSPLPATVQAPAIGQTNAPRKDSTPAEDRAGEGQYAGRVAGEIEKHKVYPASAKELGMTGDVVLAYTISRQGSVVEASILKSSGFKLLDETALKALRASRFDAMTAGLWPGAPGKTFTTTVHFALDD